MWICKRTIHPKRQHLNFLNWIQNNETHYEMVRNLQTDEAEVDCFIKPAIKRHRKITIPINGHLPPPPCKASSKIFAIIIAELQLALRSSNADTNTTTFYSSTIFMHLAMLQKLKNITTNIKCLYCKSKASLWLILIILKLIRFLH